MKSRTRNRRIAAVVFAVVALGAAAFTIAVKPLNTGGEAGTDPASITSYRVEMTLHRNGVLDATETITAHFPVSKHGIFRIFDTADPRRRQVTHPIDELSVTRDGQSEPWEWVGSAAGTSSARIGSASALLMPGDYVYVLKWRTHDVLEPSTKDSDTTWWWWDVIGSGWQIPIDDVSATVALPAEPTQSECVYAKDSPCTAKVEGRTLSVSLPHLDPFQALTVRVSMPAKLVPPNSTPSPVLPIGAGLLGAGLAGAGLVTTRERKPGFPVLYEPPQGVRPVVGAEVLDEKMPDSALQATLFDLGDRGVVRIESNGSDWVVEMVGDAIASHSDAWEIDVLSRLGLSQVGDRFVVSSTKTAGEKISRAQKVLEAEVNEQSRAFLHMAGIGTLVKLLSWVGLGALVVLAGGHFIGGWNVPMWLLGLLAGFTAVGAFAATDPGSSTKRTEAGVDVWSRVGGFARFLTTDSSESRFDAAAHLDWYPRYLPWAIALGVGDEWTKRYQAQGVEVPDVPYVPGWYAMGGMQGFSSFDNSFNSAIASASAAYAASQSSSGGGFGGGFGGGSGGGGGGGGSW